MPMKHCKIIRLPKIASGQGNLTVIENKKCVPFKIARVYYLYDVPGGESRGGHAHKNLEQFIIAVSGSFDVRISNGKKTKIFHLNRAHFGIYIPPMYWRTLDNFSSGSVCLVLASKPYNESDYYRDFQHYKNALRKHARSSAK